MKKISIAAIAMTTVLVSNLAFAQACNCQVTPQTDGSFNVNCASSSTVVLMINQPKVVNVPPISTTVPTTTPPVVVTKPPAQTQTTAEQQRIQALRDRYKNDPSVYIDDTGRMHFK